MNKIEAFLKFTLPTAVITSLSYEIFYLLGMDISISETPLSNGDILRGWQQWYVYLIPILFLTLFPTSFIKIVIYANRKPTKGSEEHKNAQKITLKLINFLTILAFLMLTIYLLLGDQAMALLILSFSIFSFRFFASLTKDKIINYDFLLIATIICLFSSTIGSYASLMGRLDSYKSLFNENSYVEVDGYRKTVIRNYENWTLVRYGFESYAWLHHQSDRKIIHNTDKTYFLGAICYFQRKSHNNNSLSNYLCNTYEKVKVIESGDDENCLIDAFKKTKDVREDTYKNCILKKSK